MARAGRLKMDLADTSPGVPAVPTGPHGAQDEKSRRPMDQHPDFTIHGHELARWDKLCVECGQEYETGCKGIHVEVTLSEEIRLNGVVYKANRKLKIPADAYLTYQAVIVR